MIMKSLSERDQTHNTQSPRHPMKIASPMKDAVASNVKTPSLLNNPPDVGVGVGTGAPVV